MSGGELDLEEGALIGVRLGEVEDEEVREDEFGQRVGAVFAGGPVGLTVETVPERQVRVQPGPAGVLVGAAEVERVLHVVEVPDLKVAVHRVELLRRQPQVGYLGPPGALEPDVEPASREGLRDHAIQLSTAKNRTVDLDNQAEDVLAVQVDRARIGERELSRGDRLQRGRRIHDERIPPRAGEHASAAELIPPLVAHPYRDHRARRQRTHAFLP